jgi:hypothetical protein
MEEKKMMVKEKKKERTKEEEMEEKKMMVKEKKKEKRMVWVHLKMTKTISSTIGALVGASSLEAKWALKEPESKINSISNLGLDILLLISGIRIGQH